MAMKKPTVESWQRYTRQGVEREYADGRVAVHLSARICLDTRPRLDFAGWDLAPALARIGDPDAFISELLAAAPGPSEAQLIQRAIDSPDRTKAVSELLWAVLLAEHEKKAAKGRASSKADASWKIIDACEDVRIARLKRNDPPLSPSTLLANIISKRNWTEDRRNVSRRSEIRAYFAWIAHQ